MTTPIGRAIPGERRAAHAVHALEADAPRRLRTIGGNAFPERPSAGAFSALTASLSQLGHDRMALTASRVWRSKNRLRGDVS